MTSVRPAVQATACRLQLVSHGPRLSLKVVQVPLMAKAFSVAQRMETLFPTFQNFNSTLELVWELANSDWPWMAPTSMILMHQDLTTLARSTMQENMIPVMAKCPVISLLIFPFITRLLIIPICLPRRAIYLTKSML